MAEAVLIHDPETDGNRKFVVRLMNKSVVEALDEIDARALEYEDEAIQARVDSLGAEDEPDSPEVRRQAIQLAHDIPEIRERFIAFDCERLDALLKPSKLKDDGEVSAGAFVAKLWADGEIAREWIDEWIEDAKAKAVKRPR